MLVAWWGTPLRGGPKSWKEGDNPKGPEPQPPATPVKTPPPLFPRHRRGLYTNGQKMEVIDATPQSPPLETDDPGVPDAGEYEINLLTAADLATAQHRFNRFEVDANYGTRPRLTAHDI